MLPSQIPVEAAVTWQESPVQSRGRRVWRDLNGNGESTPRRTARRLAYRAPSDVETAASYGTSRFKRARMRLEKEQQLEREASAEPEAQITNLTNGYRYEAEIESDWNITGTFASDNEILNETQSRSMSLEKVAETVLARLGATESDTSLNCSPLVPPAAPMHSEQTDVITRTGLLGCKAVCDSPILAVGCDVRSKVVASTPRARATAFKPSLHCSNEQSTPKPTSSTSGSEKHLTELSFPSEVLNELLNPDPDLMQQACASQRIDVSATEVRKSEPAACAPTRTEYRTRAAPATAYKNTNANSCNVPRTGPVRPDAYNRTVLNPNAQLGNARIVAPAPSGLRMQAQTMFVDSKQIGTRMHTNTVTDTALTRPTARASGPLAVPCPRNVSVAANRAQNMVPVAQANRVAVPSTILHHSMPRPSIAPPLQARATVAAGCNPITAPTGLRPLHANANANAHVARPRAPCNNRSSELTRPPTRAAAPKTNTVTDFPDDDATFSQLSDVLNQLESQHYVRHSSK